MIRQEKAEDGRVWVITLDRPKRRNALDVDHWSALAAAVREVTAAGTRAVVLTGPDSSLCAGADLNQVAGDEMAERIEGAFAVVRETPIRAGLRQWSRGRYGHPPGRHLRFAFRQAHGAFAIPAAAICLPVHPGTIRRLAALAGSGSTRTLGLVHGQACGNSRASSKDGASRSRVASPSATGSSRRNQRRRGMAVTHSVRSDSRRGPFTRASSR